MKIRRANESVERMGAGGTRFQIRAPVARHHRSPSRQASPSTNIVRRLGLCGLFILICGGNVAQGAHHYVFFNRDRERISDAAFVNTKAFEGAQLKYTWSELEPEKGMTTSSRSEWS